MVKFLFSDPRSTGSIAATRHSPGVKARSSILRRAHCCQAMQAIACQKSRIHGPQVHCPVRHASYPAYHADVVGGASKIGRAAPGRLKPGQENLGCVKPPFVNKVKFYEN
jgi:hypothetical protein